MVGSYSFSGSQLPAPAGQLQRNPDVITNRDAFLLEKLNLTVGAGNFQLPDVAAGSGNSNKTVKFGSGSTTSLSYFVRTSSDFSISADGTSGQVFSTNGAGVLSPVNNAAEAQYARQTGSFTIAVNTKRQVQAGVTVTLPNSPTDGQAVWIKPDTDANFESSALIIAQNAEADDIGGANENLTVSLNAELKLVFSEEGDDWEVIVNPIFR